MRVAPWQRGEMPSYALNQFIDLDDVMCKLLNLDLREPPKMSALPVSPVGHKKLRPPCSFSSSSSCLSDPKVNAAGSGGHWGQPSLSSGSSGGDMALPSSWNKMAFWAERSVSMVESSSSSLGWASTTEPSGCKPTSASSCTSLPSLPASVAASCSPTTTASSTTSTRYKTELCRTYAERGICKYGSKCQFAHGTEEVRDINRHPKYKTEPCRTFHSVGFCPYGIRCHFVHNNEDDLGPRPKSSSLGTPPPPSSSSSSSSLSPPGRAFPTRPPLLKQSFSFAGFPSNPPPPVLDASLPHAFLRAPSVSPPASATDLSELLSLAFPDVDPASASFMAAAAAATAAALELEAGRGDHHHFHHHQHHLPIPQHQQPPQFLPSPDSGCSTCSLTCSCSSSATSSPALPSPPHTCLPEPLSAAAAAGERFLQRSPPGAVALPGAFTGASSIPITAASAMGARSLSHTSLSDQEGGCGSSASSLSGSDSGASGFEGVGRRLPIFSQLSVPDDGFCSEGSCAGGGGGGGVGFFL